MLKEKLNAVIAIIDAVNLLSKDYNKIEYTVCSDDGLIQIWYKPIPDTMIVRLMSFFRFGFLDGVHYKHICGDEHDDFIEFLLS